MDGDTTPWKLPKPHPSAFSSGGTLPKKKPALPERHSLPKAATPGTPSKKTRNKFIVPANLSPFALSPQQVVRTRGLAEHPTPARRPVTALSHSYTAQHPDDGEEPSSLMELMSRSSSPLHNPPHTTSLMDEYEEDIFSSSETLQVLSEFSNKEYCDFTKSHAHCPWKSPRATFFDYNYFCQDNWSRAHLAPSPVPPPACHFPATATSVGADGSHADRDYLEGTYEILDTLGRGSFSEVYKVRRKHDNLHFALKRTREPFSGSIDRIRKLQEVSNMWMACTGANCVRICESWEQYGYLHIVMELCENGSLQDVIEYMSSSNSRFTEYQIWKILLQIATGLGQIHLAGIVHLDIKPANVLIDRHGNLKIGDFGLSMRLGESRDPDMEGDKYYMAPETLEGIYGPAADIFSLGLLVLEIAADVELPSQGASWQNLRHGDFSELAFDDISEALNLLIKEMTDPDPERRPHVAEILRRATAYSDFLARNT